MPCCVTITCRICAVQHLDKSSDCWSCKSVNKSSSDLKILTEYRTHASDLRRGKLLPEDVRAELVARYQQMLPVRERRRREYEEHIEQTEGAHLDEDLDERSRPKNDWERFDLAKKRFKNPVDVDPHVNLTFHGYKRKLMAGSGRRRAQVNPRSFTISEGRLEPRENYVKVRKLSSTQSPPVSVIDQQSEPVSFTKVQEKVKEVMLEKLKDRYQGHYTSQDSLELKCFCKHYSEGCLETMTFCAMYNSNNNMSSMVSGDKLAQIVGTEKHLRSYSQYYGQQSEKLVCDICKEVHGF